jgi:hypothetical protein
MILPHAQAVATMSEPFDPYRKWLGIPPKDQPPNHYRLLGIAHFEDDPDVIENAATRQMTHVRMFQSGKHSALSQKILNELTAAKLCLLRVEKKTLYDDQLRARLAAEGKLSSENLRVTSEVMEEPSADIDTRTYEHLPRVEMPETRRAPVARWKTETGEVHSAEPPIVPIPMPLGTAVAAQPRLSPWIPHTPSPLMVSGPSRSSYRPKKSTTTLPIAMAMIGLVVLFGGGIAAVALSGAFSKPAEKQPKRTSVPQTNFPVGTPSKEKEITSTFSPGTPSLERPEPPKKKPFDRGTVEDELRQAVFLGRQALEGREADTCQTHVATAENLLAAHSEVDPSLKEQVRLLRELMNLIGEFWSLVRDGAINGKVPSGVKLNYRKANFELVSHEGDRVTYKLAGKKYTAPLMEIHARAALALAFHSTKENYGKRMAMLAFGMIDKKAADENFDNNWAKNFYTGLALKGHTNAVLARELGVEEKPGPATTKGPRRGR